MEKQAYLLVHEFKIEGSKICVKNKLHRNLDYYFCKPQTMYYE